MDSAPKITAPYPGLRPFEFWEEEIFFGRAEQIDEMLAKLEQHRFLSVVGASGCGKSSLVRAGLLPAIRDGYLGDGGTNWKFLIIRPGSHPMRNLATALHSDDITQPASESDAKLNSENQNLATEVAFTTSTLRRSPLGLIRAVTELGLINETDSSEDPTQILLLVDQFEEIFRFRDSEGRSQSESSPIFSEEDEAVAFVNLLLSTVRDASIPIYIVTTMRSDFSGDCDAFNGLPELMNQSQFLTPRLTLKKMEEAIAGPAKRFRSEVSPGLSRAILNDIKNDRDQLPLVQHTLRRIWDLKASSESDQRVLSKEDYENEQIGGLDHALSRHADETFQKLSPEDQAIAEKLFRALCQQDSSGRLIRRPVYLREVLQVTGAERDPVASVIEHFRAEGRSFLAPPPTTPLDADTRLDLHHESLLRKWIRLRDWAKTESESALIFRRTKQAALEWKEGKGELWAGRNLAAATDWIKLQKPTEEWTNRYGGDLATVQEFVAASEAAQDRARKKEQRHKLLKVVTVMSLVFVIIATGLAIYADRQKGKAEDERERAETATTQAIASQRLADAKALEAAEAAAKAKLEAERADDQAEAASLAEERANLQAARAIEESKEAARQTELATKAQAAAERAEADALTQAKLVTQEKQKATRNLFDSHLTRASLIAQNEDFQSAIAALNEAEAMLSTVENKEIITTNRLSTLAMLDWFTDINSGLLENRLRDHGARWHALALHPRTERLAVVGEFGQVQLLSTDLERDEKQSLTGHATEDSIVRCVDFAPDGTWFATSGDDGMIIRWQVSNDEGEAKRLDQWRASSSIKSLQITPDGKHIVYGGASKFIILSDLTGVEIWRSEELIDEVVTIAIEQAPSPSAPLLVACSDKSGYVYNWDLQRTGKGYISAPNTPITRSLDIGFVLSLDFHVDTLTGTRLAGGSTESDIFIWQTHSADAELHETTQATQQLRGHSNAINALVFESSRRLLSASSDRTLREWNIASGITEKLFQGHATGVRGIAIEGSSVYSASVGGEIIHWDLETEEDSVHKTFHGEWISAVAATPQGKHMAANSGSTVKIFDPSANEVRTLATPETRQPMGSANQTFISRMDYNQAGSRLAATSIDGTVTFWNNISGGEPPRVLTPLGKGVVINDLTFSPDHSGRWLIGVGDFGTSSDEFNGNPKLTQKKKPIQRRGAGGAVFVYDTIADETITLGTPAPETLAVCFYPKSTPQRFLTGGSGGNVRHWTIDSTNNNRVSSPSVIGDFGKLVDSEAIATIAINSQGTLIAIGGRSGSIQVFDGDAKRKTVLEGHENTIVDLSFHPCGTILLSLSADQTIKAWDLDGLSSVDFADSNLQSSALLFTLRLPLPKSSNESSWEVWDFDVWWNSTAETSIGNIYIPATEYNRANPNLFKGYLMHYPILTPILTERF